MKQVLRELKKTEVQNTFKTIVVDTVDIAGSLCEKYICTQNEVDTLSQIPYGQGWTKVKKEFEETFRMVTQLGYALIFISHAKDKTFKRKDGTEYNQIVASCASSYNEIAKNMSDIIGYIDVRPEGRKLILRSTDGSVDVGCRFKMIAPEIPFGYQSLVDSLNEAIDAEAKETNGAFVSNERESAVIAKSYDYDALRNEFDEITSDLMQKDSNYYGPRIVQIVDKILGKGKKVSDTTRDQAEFIYLIITEIKDELAK